MREAIEQRWAVRPRAVSELGREPPGRRIGVPMMAKAAGLPLPMAGSRASLPRSAPLPLSPEVLREAIDRLPLAVLVMHGDGTVGTCNTAARQVLLKSDGLVLSGSSLVSSRPPETRALHDRIAAAAGRAGTDHSTYAILTVSRPSGLAPFILLIASLGDTAGAATGGEPMALVLVGDLEWPIPDHARQLRLAFALTEAEAGVAMALMDGAEPKEIARRRGVRVSTIRTQIKMIFAKTGAGRQADLVKLIARLPSLGRS